MRGSDKRREAIERNPRHVRFEELDALLRSRGFARRQSGGGSSHYTYVRWQWHGVVAVHRPHLKECIVHDALNVLRAVDDEEAEEG
jgi:hypothetical protein